MPSDPKTEEITSRTGIVNRLLNLTSVLQALYTQVSARLLQGRTEAAKQPKAQRDALPISKFIDDSLNDSAPIPARKKGGLFQDEPTFSQPYGGEVLGRRSQGARRLLPDLFNGLKLRFAQRRSSQYLEPFMREKMRKNALSHVNKALALAREGQADGARIHAELAENAMKTAGEYMSDEDYRQFREELEAKLRSRGD